MHPLARAPNPINVLYSIDYEVFWTRNDDEIRVLVDPTERLLDLAEELGFRYTLFVDVLCLLRYRELGADRFVDAVENQLRDAVARGHDVQTHLHPHWLTAERNGNEWSFEPDAFLLGNLGDADQVYQQATELLSRAQRYLEGLLRPVAPAYRTVAYRAGGYGLQPRERSVLKALQDTGYRIDSSVVPGMRLITGRNVVDFTAVPARGNWIIGPEGGLERESASGLLEVPVAGGSADLLPFAWQLVAYIKRRLGAKQPFLDGYGHSRDLSQGRAAQTGSLAESLARKFRILASRWSYLSMSSAPVKVLSSVTDNWIMRHAGKDPIAFSVLLHSKGLTQGTLDDVRGYTEFLKRCYGERLAFLAFSELALMLHGERAGASAEVSP